MPLERTTRPMTRLQALPAGNQIAAFALAASPFIESRHACGFQGGGSLDLALALGRWSKGAIIPSVILDTDDSQATFEVHAVGTMFREGRTLAFDSDGIFTLPDMLAKYASSEGYRSLIDGRIPWERVVPYISSRHVTIAEHPEVVAYLSEVLRNRFGSWQSGSLGQNPGQELQAAA